MGNKEIAKRVNDVLAELIEVLKGVTNEQYNTIPFEGSWTAGQLAQHMIMANSGFVESINGPVKDTERQADELDAQIAGIFLNFDVKLTTPDFIQPALVDYDKAEQIATLETVRSKAVEAIEKLDLTKTCTGFEIPVLGYLTRLESAYFIIYHTTRHVRQLKNIHQTLIK